MTERSRYWSITINNPTPEDLAPLLPSGWEMIGQIEKGSEGTRHYQGMLHTPQTRFGTVKKVLPRAHIEVARNKAALLKYVQKEDTRIEEVNTIKSEIPSLFGYLHEVAAAWDEEEFQGMRTGDDEKMEDMALRYVNLLVSRDIESGRQGLEYIAINPMWIKAWKTFYRPLVKRERSYPQHETQDRQDNETKTIEPPAIKIEEQGIEDQNGSLCSS